MPTLKDMLNEIIKDLVAMLLIIGIICGLCWLAVDAWDKESNAREKRVAAIIKEMGR